MNRSLDKKAASKNYKDGSPHWHSDKIPKVDDPFKLVSGMLRHLKGKKTSVQLQHGAMDLWAKDYNKK